MASPRAKFIFSALTFIIGGLALIVALVETQETMVMLAFFLWILGGSFLLTRIRCLECGVPVVFQGSLGGISIYAGFVRSKCQNCGADLNRVG